MPVTSAQERVAQLSRERIRVRNQAFGLVESDVLPLLRKRVPDTSKLLVARLEELIAKDEQLANDILVAKRDL